MSGSYIKDGERIIDEGAETKPPVLEEPVIVTESAETTAETATAVTGE